MTTGILLVDDAALLNVFDMNSDCQPDIDVMQTSRQEKVANIAPSLARHEENLMKLLPSNSSAKV